MPEINDVLRLLPMLKGIPAGCLLALLLLGPLDLGGLTQATGYSRWRVGEALVLLQTLGLVAAVGQAWTASRGLAERLPRVDSGTPEVHECESALESSLVKFSLEDSDQESLKQESSLVTKLDSEVKKSPNPGEVEKILALSEVLFGEPVLLGPGLEVDAQCLLGLLAEAYSNRSKLRKPARVVAANIKAGRTASLRFHSHPRAYLPTEFLRLLDQSEADDLESDEEEVERDESELSESNQLQDGQVLVPAAPDPSESQRLWGAAREELERSLPKASFESYVRPVAAVDYDPQQGQLFLEAADGQSCAWLDRHLKRILERLMVGITGEVVEVVFLPPDPGAPDAGEGGAE